MKNISLTVLWISVYILQGFWLMSILWMSVTDKTLLLGNSSIFSLVGKEKHEITALLGSPGAILHLMPGAGSVDIPIKSTERWVYTYSIHVSFSEVHILFDDESVSKAMFSIVPILLSPTNTPTIYFGYLTMAISLLGIWGWTVPNFLRVLFFLLWSITLSWMEVVISPYPLTRLTLSLTMFTTLGSVVSYATSLMLLVGAVRRISDNNAKVE